MSHPLRAQSAVTVSCYSAVTGVLLPCEREIAWAESALSARVGASTGNGLDRQQQ